MIDLNPQGCSLYVALLHHSMRDKNGVVVTTSVTNLDIHDIARSARTFGVKKYFLVNPLPEQHQVVARILQHWNGHAGRDYNPDRAEAFKRVQMVDWLKDAVSAIEAEEKVAPLVWMTSARETEDVVSLGWQQGREMLQGKGSTKPVLLVFGTGWGMIDELLREADAVLDPIFPEQESGYNHLSVRSAVAIALDRLLGRR